MLSKVHEMVERLSKACMNADPDPKKVRWGTIGGNTIQHIAQPRGLQYSSFISMPIDRKPFRLAKRREVPLPAKGSRTMPLGGVVARIGIRTSCSENEALWEVPPLDSGTSQVSAGGM